MRTYLCSLTVHIFLFYLPLVSKITGVRPEKCSKSLIFYVEASTKGFVTFFVTLTADEKPQFVADLSVYLRLQDSYIRLQGSQMACDGRGWLAMVVSKLRKGG